MNWKRMIFRGGLSVIAGLLAGCGSAGKSAATADKGLPFQLKEEPVRVPSADADLLLAFWMEEQESARGTLDYFLYGEDRWSVSNQIPLEKVLARQRTMLAQARKKPGKGKEEEGKGREDYIEAWRRSEIKAAGYLAKVVNDMSFDAEKPHTPEELLDLQVGWVAKWRELEKGAAR